MRRLSLASFARRAHHSAGSFDAGGAPGWREVPRRVPWPERLALCSALFGLGCAGLAVAIGVALLDLLLLAMIARMLFG
jgi:hypothetical protein